MMSRTSYLILDTNIWVYTTRLLSTAMGAATLYSLHQTGRVLMLPEVIEEEIKKHTLKRGKEAVEAIRENYRLIEQLMGARDDFKVPSEDNFSLRVDARFLELEGLIKRTPFTLEQAKAALKRVMEETPPNGYKNQQFKDSIIWEVILNLANEGDVDFVTEDTGFFKDRKNPQKGLADNLKKDCETVSGVIRVFYKISNYLQSIKEELPPLNYPEIATIINGTLWEQLNKKAVDRGFELNELIDHKISAFLTEKSNIIAIEFQLSYSTQGVKLPELGEQIEAIEIVKGDCTYELQEKRVSDIQFDNIFLEDKSGERIPGYGQHFLRAAGAILGRRTIPYTLRERLEE